MLSDEKEFFSLVYSFLLGRFRARLSIFVASRVAQTDGIAVGH